MSIHDALNHLAPEAFSNDEKDGGCGCSFCLAPWIVGVVCSKNLRRETRNGKQFEDLEDQVETSSSGSLSANFLIWRLSYWPKGRSWKLFGPS
jgi:hypothetical protein